MDFGAAAAAAATAAIVSHESLVSGHSIRLYIYITYYECRVCVCASIYRSRRPVIKGSQQREPARNAEAKDEAR